MTEYQCSSCGTVYSFYEYVQLERVQAVENEENPTAKDGHGYHTVCECGHEFHEDEWQVIDEVETAEGDIQVSTTHLVLNHGMGRGDLWYETCVFWSDGSNVVDRYETQESAENSHKEIVSEIKAGNFRVQESQYPMIEIGEE